MGRKNILVVDDEVGIRAMIRAMLAKYADHVLFEAESAEAARIMLADRFFDLVITDNKMPGESGMDFARFCHATYPHTAIITMTGFGSHKVARESLEIGVYGHLNKPFDSDQLIIAVDNALKRLELEQQQRDHLAELEKMVDQRTALLRKTLHSMEKMQKELRESEKKYRSILDNIQEAYYRVDMDGRILMANPAGVAMLGFVDHKELIGKDVKTFFADPEELKTFRKQLDLWGKVADFELTLRRRGNTILSGLASTRIMTDGSGEPVGMEGIFVDITRRKRMEEIVRESARNYRIIFEKSPLGMLRFSPEGIITDCNETLAGLMGAPKERLVGFNMAKHATGKVRDAIVKALGGELSVYEGEYTSINGNKTVELRAIMNPVQPGKSSSEVIAILEDVGQAKKARQELVLSLEANKQLIEKLPSLLIKLAEDGTILQWNPVAEKILGIPAENVMGKPLQDSHVNWDWGAIRRAMCQCLDQEVHIRLERMPFRRDDGYEGVLGLTVTPICIDPRKKRSLLIMGADITERLNLETQLSHARKLESVGQLAAGIAHEINTPTQYISDNTHFFRDSFEDIRDVVGAYRELFDACAAKDVEPELREHIDDVLEEADWEFLEEEIPQAIDQSLEGLERVADIVRSMKDFSHPGTKEKTATVLWRVRSLFRAMCGNTLPIWSRILTNPCRPFPACRARSIRFS